MLTELCLRSKAVWGYGEEFIEACRAELAITSEHIASSHVVVAETDGRIVGIAQLNVFNRTAVLEKLFVEPATLKSGVGRRLFTWAKDEAKKLGSAALIVDSDPGAAEFYRHLGASDDGTVSSGSISGRVIPRLKVTL